MSDTDDPLDTPAGNASFLTTRWSRVFAAGGADPADAREALAELCGNYWYPLYAFVRRRRTAEDARDLVQGFFAKLLARSDLGQLSPERGRFRAFLLAAMKNHLANERDRDEAQKRGGGRVSLSIDFEAADARFRAEPVDEESPERAFERTWALALLDRTLDTLAAEYETTGRGQLFEALKSQLQATPDPRGHAERAAELGLSPGAFKVAVHRLRRRYRDRLRAEIAETISVGESGDSTEIIEDELRALFEALGG